ncbi:aminotransferase class I/II-fold pyridoxal phosphate-dependent enzyme [Planosporangium sp. 12N6]|uniref:aminotransferase class I/II-fold pyridoxal phosphate-dependent enzyme n=1 Tax=Planosporangium spinosum TaxID=3402278 RepID=UPI003CF13FB9
MTQLSPTSRVGIAADVCVLSTGDVRVPVFTDSPAVRPRPVDQAYPAAAGATDLRAAIAGPLPAEQVLVAPGGRLAILSVLATALGDRPEVLLPVPYWASYPTLIRAAGGVPVTVPGAEPARSGAAGLEVARLEAARTRRTGAVVINSPRNPDGAVLPLDTLREVAGWADRHGVLVLFDQIYRGVPLGPVAAPTILDLGADLPERYAVIDGLTKSHALAGIRLGWALAPKDIIGAATAHASHVVGGTSSVTQDLALAALRDSAAIQDRLRPLLRSNLTSVRDALGDVAGVDCPIPDAGIFCFPDLRRWRDRLAPAEARDNPVAWLRDVHRVAVVDGAAFGAPGHVRFSFALPADELRVGVGRLRAALTVGAG